MAWGKAAISYQQLAVSSQQSAKIQDWRRRSNVGCVLRTIDFLKCRVGTAHHLLICSTRVKSYRYLMLKILPEGQENILDGKASDLDQGLTCFSW